MLANRLKHYKSGLKSLGACPRIRRGRAHGACTASARREEEAMSMHIVDDEQRSDRRATPMRPLGSGLEGASASLALLDDVHGHRFRRAALHLPRPSPGARPLRILGQAPRVANHLERFPISRGGDFKSSISYQDRQPAGDLEQMSGGREFFGR